MSTAPTCAYRQTRSAVDRQRRARRTSLLRVVPLSAAFLLTFSTADAHTLLALQETSHRGGEPWHVDPVPEVTIGILDGAEEYVLPRVIDATVLSDGTIVIGIFAGSLFELRYFDDEGVFLTTAGRFGDGPFEVGRRGMCCLARLPGDSILIVGNDNRFSVFGPRGEQVRSGRWQSVAPFLEARLIDENHLGIVREGEAERSSDGRYVSQALYIVLDLSAATLDTVATSEGLTVWMGGAGMFEGAFSASARSAAGAGTYWFGGSAQSQLAGVSMGDAHPLALSIVRPQTPITRDSKNRYKEHDLRGWSGDQRRAVESHHRRLAFPDSMPRFQHVKVDEIGNVWVMQYEPRWSTEPYRWDVYDPGGAWLQEVSVPFEVLAPCLRAGLYGGCPTETYELGDDYILSAREDDLGVPQVKRYRLVKG